MRRARCGWLIRHGRFQDGEPEYGLLDRYVSPGDWVLDIGANIGTYTLRLSELVGRAGRVVAAEPVPDTFALLTANVAAAQCHNVTLLNVAASDGVAVANMDVPEFDTGLKNYYQAAVTSGTEGVSVLTTPLVGLVGHHRVSFVKIDVEGHEAFALRGVEPILRRDHPVVLIECTSPEPHEILQALGYERQPDLPDSPNHTFFWKGDAGSPEV
jgi:FkbM family methyltransferase